MEVLRTPDARFAGLPDFAFPPHYLEVGSPPLRLHYVDEGNSNARPVLLMHGEPSWCYLYRKIIPPLAAQGHRVLAPDLIGFGRSDKPAKRSDYTFERHVDWMSEFLVRLDLNDITLFCQDWGGLIGLRAGGALSGALRSSRRGKYWAAGRRSATFHLHFASGSPSANTYRGCRSAA